jgi:hypothetical protein
MNCGRLIDGWSKPRRSKVMMNYGGSGGLGWVWMGFAVIALLVVIALVVWAVSSFNRRP